MRYHIDTIPVWDAVKLNGECPLCALRRRNELIDVDRFLGASVMEPDVRVRVNEKGFCARHQEMLYRQKNRLGQALLLQSHLAETEKSLAGRPTCGAKKRKYPLVLPLPLRRTKALDERVKGKTIKD